MNMENFREIEPKTLTDNPFALIGERWALLTAGSPGDCNMMTVSWGHFGVMWHLPTVWCHVRPSRHTYGYVERESLFTLSFFDEEHRNVLEYCGSHSGRDGDKVEACDLTVCEPAVGAVAFEEAKIIVVCRKLYAKDLDPDGFMDERIAKNYPNGDYHRMYLAEVVSLLVRED